MPGYLLRGPRSLKNQHEDQDEVITLLTVLLQLKILIPQTNRRRVSKMEGRPGGQLPHNSKNDVSSLGFLSHPFSPDGVFYMYYIWKRKGYISSKADV